MEYKVRNLKDLMDYLESNKEILQQRATVESFLASKYKDHDINYFPGYCRVCEKPQDFVVDWAFSANGMPCFRERTVCPECSNNNRQRYMLGYLKDEVKLIKDKGQKAKVYMYEQTTSFYKNAKKIEGAEVIGSEFLGFDVKPGEVIDGIRHEDALNLSFQNEEFDIIVSNDVFEHVADYKLAFQEVYRVLKNDGKIIFTMPFYSNIDKTVCRAKIVNGKLENVLPPVYHGNPISNKGSLVFFDYGWDVINDIKQIGFKDVYMEIYYDYFYGNIGNRWQFMFRAEK